MKQEAFIHNNVEVILEAGNAEKFSPSKTLYEWAETIAWCFIFVVLLSTFAISVRVIVDGSSMEDTLFDGERLISLNYFIPEYQDIVVITQPNNLQKPIVKRVIATEGQTVNIDFEKGDVFVDGVLLDEKYIKDPTTVKGDINFPQVVPKGHVFVMGDNRNVSLDSRYKEIGMIDVRYIFGKAVFRFFPFSRFGRV